MQLAIFIAVTLAAIAWAIYKHFGAAKIAAELAALKGDPAKVVAEAIASARATPAQAAASAPSPSAVPVAAPAAVASPAAAPAPVAAPSEPDTAAKIRALIAQWRANGADWAQVGFYLPTGFGLGRALTPDEWTVAVAAGFPKELLEAKPAPDFGDPIDTSAPVLDYNKVNGGVEIALTGAKKITGCPDSVEVEFDQASGQTGATNTYVATVNGTDHTFSVTAEQKVVTSGPDVTVSVSCPGLAMEIRAA